MYAYLYASVVKGYIGLYGERRAHTIAMWMMGIVTTGNLFSLLRLAANLGSTGATTAFHFLKSPLYASGLALGFVGLHIALGSRYRRRAEETGKNLFEKTSRVSGDIYFFGAIVFWILVSRMGDSM